MKLKVIQTPREEIFSRLLTAVSLVNVGQLVYCHQPPLNLQFERNHLKGNHFHSFLNYSKSPPNYFSANYQRSLLSTFLKQACTILETQIMCGCFISEITLSHFPHKYGPLYEHQRNMVNE